MTEGKCSKSERARGALDRPAIELFPYCLKNLEHTYIYFFSHFLKYLCLRQSARFIILIIIQSQNSLYFIEISRPISH